MASYTDFINMNQGKYAGPVPNGYDQAFFSATGQMRKNSAPVTSGQVKGASTQRTAAPTPQAGPAPAPQGPGPAPEPQINLDEIYNPQFNALRDAEGALSAGRDEDTRQVENQYGENVKKVNVENETQTKALNTEQENFQTSVRSALAEAVRYFNALQQQAKARFGGFSSAGMAVTDIGQQEFLRNQGRIQNEETQGLQKFAQEKSRLSEYIRGKLTDLDLFKSDAMNKINQNFRSNLAQINAQKGALESQKAQAKIALLQDTQNRVSEIKAADQQFRMSLAQFSLNQLAQVTGKTFTPQEIADVMNQFMNVNLGTGAPTARSVATGPKKPATDEFQALAV